MVLYRIRATRDIPTQQVHVGDLGGWVSSAQLPDGTPRISGDAWLSFEAELFDAATIADHARVTSYAKVGGQARIQGQARVDGHAYIGGQARIYDRARIGGSAIITDQAQIGGDEWILSETIGGNTQLHETNLPVTNQDQPPSCEFTNISKGPLRRIRASIDLPHFDVSAGDLGGWVGPEVSIAGKSWIGPTATVSGAVRLSDQALITGKTQVSGTCHLIGGQVEGQCIIAGQNLTITSHIKGNIRLTASGLIATCLYGDGFVWDCPLPLDLHHHSHWTTINEFGPYGSTITIVRLVDNSPFICQFPNGWCGSPMELHAAAYDLVDLVADRYIDPGEERQRWATLYCQLADFATHLAVAWDI